MSNESNEKYYSHSRYLARRPTPWQEEPDNPIVQQVRAGIVGPIPITPPETINLNTSGKQTDNAENIARSVFIQAVPVIFLALPLAVCIAGLAWLTGLVSAGFIAFVIVVLGLWGGISLLCYNWIARRAHVFSHYGTEQKKVDAIAQIRRQELANDYSLKRAALDAYIKQLQGREDGQ